MQENQSNPDWIDWLTGTYRIGSDSAAASFPLLFFEQFLAAVEPPCNFCHKALVGLPGWAVAALLHLFRLHSQHGSGQEQRDLTAS